MEAKTVAQMVLKKAPDWEQRSESYWELPDVLDWSAREEQQC
jgi:hypothetical protein